MIKMEQLDNNSVRKIVNTYEERYFDDLEYGFTHNKCAP